MFVLDHSFHKSINLGCDIRLDFGKNSLDINAGPRKSKLIAPLPVISIYSKKNLSTNTALAKKTRQRSGFHCHFKQMKNNNTIGSAHTGQVVVSWKLQSLIEAENAQWQKEKGCQLKADIQWNQDKNAAEIPPQVRDCRETIKNFSIAILPLDDHHAWGRQFYTEPFTLLLSDKTNTAVSHEDTFQKYLTRKIAYKSLQRKHNTDIDFLRESLINGRNLAPEEYVSSVLANSKYPMDDCCLILSNYQKICIY